MKKMIVGLLFGALASFGLVAVSAPAANAYCPYDECTATVMKYKAKRQARKGKVRHQVNVRSAENAVSPSGAINVTCVNRKDGSFYAETFSYPGGVQRYTAFLEPGPTTCTASYIPADDEAFESVSGSDNVNPRKRNKRGA